MVKHHLAWHLLVLLLTLAGCGPSIRIKEAYVWNAASACWELRDLDADVYFSSDRFLLFAVDGEGTCWRIPGASVRPRDWPEQPVSTAEACGDARYSNDFCEDTGG